MILPTWLEPTPPPVVEHTISKYPASYTTSGSIRGTKYQSAIGKGADTAAVSGNDYASSSGSTAYINYAFDFSEIPDNAVIKGMSVSVKGHRESASQGTASLVIYHTGTNHNYSTVTSFTSTSAQVLEMNITELPTRQDLRQMALRFTIGYYGGLVNGATWTVTYEA